MTFAHIQTMIISACVSIAAVIGTSFLISVPVAAKYFDRYSDPFDNEFNHGVERIQHEIDNFDWGASNRSTYTLTHSYDNIHNTSYY